MELKTHTRAIATKFDWHGVGGPTAWFSVGGISHDRIPIVVTQEQMHLITSGNRVADIAITVTTISDNDKLTDQQSQENGPLLVRCDSDTGLCQHPECNPENDNRVPNESVS